ncbi:MAG: hypothetical protein NTZ07_04240, partial [Candidatus Woesebacteria bacterium]|nr:hypothetical protein [Candidatus Woesebacteria bacterium]
MVDIRQSIHYANYLQREGWIVERVGEINYFIRKFPIVGSILKIQRPEEINYDIINKLCRKYRVFQVILEPYLASTTGTISRLDHDSLLYHGFKLSKSPYLPSKTLQIDLTQGQKDIFRHFKKDARQTIKKSFDLSDSLRTNREVKNTIHQYSSPEDIIRWREAWKNSVNFKRYVPPVEQLLNLRKSFP